MSEVLPVAELVRQIHDSPVQGVIVVTGGGSRAIADLLETPGASRTVLEAMVPYAAESLAALLGAEPEQSCSARTARAMAMAAFERARRYRPQSDVENLFGLACTASLTSDRPKRGPHRLHLALQTAGATRCRTLELLKGVRTRIDEERLVAAEVLNLLAEAAQLPDRLATQRREGETPQDARTVASADWREVLLGQRPATCVGGQGDDRPRAVFPGAFNPRHEGHRAMARLAATRLGCPVHHEISLYNVEKPLLDYCEIEARLAQFAGDEPVWLSHAATFREKSALFPGATFVVGVDTVLRIGEPRFYGGNLELARRAIDEIARHGCRFLVFGRLANNRFVEAERLALPEPLAALCDHVSEADFRVDISSTALRQLSTESG